jgi:hypothetical protein
MSHVQANGIRVTSRDRLRVLNWGSTANCTLEISYRIEKDGVPIKRPTKQFQTDSGRTSGGSPFDMALLDGEGYLTYLSVTTVTKGNAAPQSRGELYVQISLRSIDDPNINGLKLISGYVLQGRDLCWSPGQPFDEDPTSGTGWIHDILQASTPLLAAGVPIGGSLVVGGIKLKVKHLWIRLITSNTVGNRLILVYIGQGASNPSSGTEGTVVMVEWVNSGTFGTGRTVAASTTEIYEITTLRTATLGQAGSTVGGGATLIYAIPQPFDLWTTNVSELQGWVQDTAHIDAANDKVEIRMIVEEWIVPIT